MPAALLARRRIGQRRAQAHEFGQRTLVIGRNAQVLEIVGRVVAHRAQEYRHAIEHDRQHVILELVRLARVVDQLVVDARPHIAQVFVLLARGAAGHRRHVLAQAEILRARLPAREILDVDHAQSGELDFHAFGLVADTCADLRRLAHHAVHLERRIARAHQRIAGQADRTAAVIETALIDGHALVAQRLIDLDGLVEHLAGLGVRDLDQAEEAAGHAGGVVIDRELLQPQRERQRLHQRPVVDRDGGQARVAALRNPEIGPVAGVVDRQQGAVRNVCARHFAVDGDRLLAVEQYLQPHRRLAVEQAADADDDHRRVREDVAQAVGAAFLGRQHDAVAIAALAHGVAELAQQAGHALCRLADRLRHLGLDAVREGPQAAGAHVLAERARLPQHLEGIADQAHRGGHHQERHDQQEPPAVVDVPDGELVEHLEPERPELVHVHIAGTVLGQYRPHDAGDADKHQQADGETHRAQQFEDVAGQAAQGMAGGGGCGSGVHEKRGAAQSASPPS
ncbi:Uncharacterised protein [Bordetella pertussis]|nr:Uncharacterised protein [Bordetella pertussis]